MPEHKPPSPEAIDGRDAITRLLDVDVGFLRDNFMLRVCADFRCIDNDLDARECQELSRAFDAIAGQLLTDEDRKRRLANKAAQAKPE